MLCPNTVSHYWVVREKYTQKFIGLVSLDTHHVGTDLEVSYQFLPHWWGKGYATEVVGAVIHIAFHEFNLPRIVAETQTANKVSCRLLEKLGRALERTVMRFGAEQAIYSITRCE
ncbi:GNAT family N-acetyltransferase [Virgibacillus sp. 179-BFC.A HS]|uniref:GNAT family N-acetyltransferase n=1 Tax=Tigheibacillus jepli TaxID=3035914 RepID=A0ABU5CKD3_9BACI|nr:GNAT family N-acetyltransferase [Virgibacillus sp. 179-BFC.A HS]MDY0406771.1 GNAT family N-acetyltransferase [Virgibacillus sp. 179-BFC.A HS]